MTDACEPGEFIARKLGAVYNEFLTDLKANPSRLREIKPRQFTGRTEVDYSKSIQRNWYMLRYLVGYLAEYCHMYSALVSTKMIPEALHVASIGCGCGIDAWALALAQRSRRDGNIGTFDYTGFDAIRWQHRAGPDGHEPRIHCHNVLELKTLGRSYNVFSFAKSLSELSKTSGDRTALRSILGRTSLFGEHIALLVSSTRVNREDDWRVMDELAESIARARGLVRVAEEVQFSGEDCSRRLADVYEWAAIPEPVFSFFGNPCAVLRAERACPEQCDACEFGKGQSCYPIATSKEILYRIVFLSHDGTGGGACSGEEVPF